MRMKSAELFFLVLVLVDVLSTNICAILDQETGSFEKENLNKGDVIHDILSKNQLYNPVLQNHSALLDWLAKIDKTKSELNVQDLANGKNGGRRRKRSVAEVDCRGLCSQSLCPWNEEWDIEPRRVPRFIKYAACASTACEYNIRGISDHLKTRLQQYTYCDKVRTDIMVIENGVEKWLTNWPIACICARNPTYSTDDVLISVAAVGLAANSVSSRLRNVARSSSPQNHPYLANDAQHESLRLRDMSREQRRRLKQQRRKMFRNSESFEELMARKMNQSD